jgi:hypothetical protein
MSTIGKILTQKDPEAVLKIQFILATSRRK